MPHCIKKIRKWHYGVLLMFSPRSAALLLLCRVLGLVLSGISVAQANKRALTEGLHLGFSSRRSNNVNLGRLPGIHTLEFIKVNRWQERVVLGSRIGVVALKCSASHIYKRQGQRFGNQGYIRPVGAD